MRVRVWFTWSTFNFCDPLHILGTTTVIEFNACSVCSAFDAALAKLLWLLFCLRGCVNPWQLVKQTTIDQAIDQWRVTLIACIWATNGHSEHLIFLPALMLRSGIVFDGICVSVSLSAQNHENYSSEIDETWQECSTVNAKSDSNLVTFDEPCLYFEHIFNFFSNTFISNR